MTIDLSRFVTVDDAGNPTEQPRPETKSWPDVIQVINHWHGLIEGDSVIDRFIAMYSDGQQWDWYDDYHDWELKVQAIQQQNASRQPDENGKLPEPLPLPKAPERPVPESPVVLKNRALKEIHDNFVAIENWQKQVNLVVPER